MTKGITLQEIDTSATSRLVIKDSAGRAKVSDPSAADDIALKRTVDNAVGTLSSLLTTDKSNVVKAINELFTNVSNGKNSVAAAITGKGVPASGSDTFAQLSAKIGQIVTGKRYASGEGTQDTTIQRKELTNTITFEKYNSPYVVIQGLPFVPSVINIYGGIQNYSLTTYKASSISPIVDRMKFMVSSVITGNTGAKAYDSAVLTGPTYEIPVFIASNTFKFTWEAWE